MRKNRVLVRVARLTSMLAASTAVVALAPAAASANNQPIHTKEAFTLTYSSPYITTNGEVVCKGYHETNSALFPGTETEGGRDIETCHSSNKTAFTQLTAGLKSNMFPGSPSYESDWFYGKGERGESIQSIHVLFLVSDNDKAFKLRLYAPLNGVYPPIAESL